MDRDSGRRVGVGVGFTSLLESNTTGASKRIAMKKKLSVKNNNKKIIFFTHLEWYTHLS